MGDLGDTIRSAFEKCGCQPVIFEKPLKSLVASVRFKKRIEAKHIIDIGAAVGWGMVSLLEFFAKELWNVKDLTLRNEDGTVEIEATVIVTLLTFEEDHQAFFDAYLSDLMKVEIKQGGYFLDPFFWAWDSIERLEPILGFTQAKGDGLPTGALDK